MSETPGLLTVNHLLKEGVPSIAVAALMSRCTQVMRRNGDDRAIGGMLETMWRVIGMHLMEELPQHGNDELGVVVAFIDQYFRCRGDWQKMEKQLCVAIDFKWPERSVQMTQLLAEIERVTEAAEKNKKA